MDLGKDGSKRLKLGTAFLYRARSRIKYGLSETMGDAGSAY
jgi:hypothetical protein